jgi:hypothetical protein
VVRRSRSPTYKHAVGKTRRMSGSAEVAVYAAKRLAKRVGTFVSKNPMRRKEKRGKPRSYIDSPVNSDVSSASSDEDRGRRRTREKRAVERPVRRATSVPALNVKTIEGMPEDFIADTGSGLNLVERSCVAEKFLSRARSLPRTIRLSTANGSTSSDQAVNLPFRPFQDNVECVVLERTPAVISVGERCETLGYGFYWPPFSAPFFVCPGADGRGYRRVVPTVTRKRVPLVKAGAVARKVSKGYIRRLLDMAADGDSSASSGTDDSGPELS